MFGNVGLRHFQREKENSLELAFATVKLVWAHVFAWPSPFASVYCSCVCQVILPMLIGLRSYKLREAQSVHEGDIFQL